MPKNKDPQFDKQDRLEKFLLKHADSLKKSGVKCSSVDCAAKDSELYDTPDTWGTFKECHTVCLVCKAVGSRITVDS